MTRQHVVTALADGTFAKLGNTSVVDRGDRDKGVLLDGREVEKAEADQVPAHTRPLWVYRPR